GDWKKCHPAGGVRAHERVAGAVEMHFRCTMDRIPLVHGELREQPARVLLDDLLRGRVSAHLDRSGQQRTALRRPLRRARRVEWHGAPLCAAGGLVWLVRAAASWW